MSLQAEGEAVSAPNNHRSWDVLLIGGAAGTGKTMISQRLAQHFAAGLTEVDDLHLVLETMTTPEQEPTLHFWKTHPEAQQFSAKEILDLHIAVGRVLLPALSAVIANHIEADTPLILEGDYILPELVAPNNKTDSFQADRVRAVFLYEPDEKQIIKNFYQREPEEGEQRGRAHVSWLYGEWLKQECERYGLAALSATPWESLFDRIISSTRT